MKPKLKNECFNCYHPIGSNGNCPICARIKPRLKPLRGPIVFRAKGRKVIRYSE